MVNIINIKGRGTYCYHIGQGNLVESPELCKVVNKMCTLVTVNSEDDT